MGRRGASTGTRTQAAAGGADGASLALRLTIGPMLVAHGLNKVAGPGGIEGTTNWFRALGLEPAAVHARLAAATEVTAGTLVTLGALGPLPEAAVIGLMTTAALTDHRAKGFFVFKGGVEYVAVVGAVAAVIAGLGHGRLSVDGKLGRTRRGGPAALAAVALGAGAAGALLTTSYRPEPSDAAGAPETPPAGDDAHSA